MIDLNAPRTLVKAGYYADSLTEAIKGFEVKLTPAEVGLGNTIKYTTFENSGIHYLLIVSQQKERKASPGGYNVLLTITSSSDIRNQEISDKFENETGIPLNLKVPEFLKRNSGIMNKTFEVCEINPERAMTILTGRV